MTRVITARPRAIVWFGILTVGSFVAELIGFALPSSPYETEEPTLIILAAVLGVVLYGVLLWLIVGRASKVAWWILLLMTVLPFILLLIWPGDPTPLTWHDVIFWIVPTALQFFAFALSITTQAQIWFAENALVRT